jgi:glutamate--cysteine ligase
MKFEQSSLAQSILTPVALATMRKGIEKEGLRIHSNGLLADSPHPELLGSTLTNQNITTDFCEQQIELISSVHDTCKGLYDEVVQLQAFVAQTLRDLGDERICCTSMPGELPNEDLIQLGQYGSSNQGKFKTTYRSGLANRYGKTMQTISGLHYNWSMANCSSADYMALMRNFRRHAPLLLLLFGVSPMVDKTFVANRKHNLIQLSPDTFHLPYATSLRLGRLGYQSEKQEKRTISFNSVEQFCNELEPLLTNNYPPYENIGLCDSSGRYLQLNTSLLQTENEFYSTIRAKRTPLSEERVLHALRTRGVEYVEVRLLDLNPFEPIGIACDEISFLDIFLVHSLCKISPSDTPDEINRCSTNLRLISERGREPNLKFNTGSSNINVITWAQDLLSEIAEVATYMDAALKTNRYSQAVHTQKVTLDNVNNLPSQKVVEQVMQHHNGSWKDFVTVHSGRMYDHFNTIALRPAQLEKLQEQAQSSIQRKFNIEQASKESFEAYLHNFFDKKRLFSGGC